MVPFALPRGYFLISQLISHPRQFKAELVTANRCLRNGGFCYPHGVVVRYSLKTVQLLRHPIGPTGTDKSDARILESLREGTGISGEV